MNTPQIEPHPAPKAIVNSLYAGFLNGRDPAAAAALISPEFTAAGGGGGVEGYIASVAPLHAAFPDLRFQIHDIIGEDFRVAVRWTWQGTHAGAFAGILPTGRLIFNEGIAIYRIEQGKIVESWAQMDRFGVLQQLRGEPPATLAVPQPARTA